MSRARFASLTGRVAVALVSSLGVHALVVALLLGAASLLHAVRVDRTILVNLDDPVAPATPPRVAAVARDHPRPRTETPRSRPAAPKPPPAPAKVTPPVPDVPAPIVPDATTPAAERPPSDTAVVARSSPEPLPASPPTDAAAEPASPSGQGTSEVAPEPTLPPQADVASTVAPAVEPLGPEAPPAEVRSLAKKASVSAHAAIEPFRIRRDILEYLLDHPEFATHVTRTLRVARYRVWETTDGLHLDDGWGAKLRFSVAPSSHGARLIRASGEYDPGLLPSVHGELIVMVDPTFARDADGRDVVTLGVTALVKLDSSLAQLVAKMARSAVTKKAELEAWRLGRVIARVSHAIEEDPTGLYEQLAARPDVPRRELQEFGALLGVR